MLDAMRRLLLTILLLLASPMQAAEWVPPGFESLDDPQVTLVDVTYGGTELGTALVEFTQTAVTFLEPEAVVSMLPNLLDNAATTAILRASFDTNADKLCHSGYEQGCGVLQPEQIGIIFDRDQLALTLFIAPHLLRTSAPQDMRFLPDSDAPLSLHSSNALYFSGTSSGESIYNLYSNTQVAWTENRLVARASLTEEAVLVDQLSFGRNYRGRELEAGLFRANADSFSFLNTQQFLGVSLQSSLLSLQSVEQYQGTRIELFLATRSRVELHSEGRLLSARFYDVGNQILDTSALPGGSYELEIRIIDAAGSQRVEYRFFSKTNRLPPAESPQYFLQLGRLYETGIALSEQDSSTNMLRAGINRRIGDRTGLRAGFATTGQHWVAETGFFRTGSNLEFQGGIAFDDTGATAREFDLAWRREAAMLGINYREVVNGSVTSLLQDDRRQLQFSLDVPTAAGTFSVFSRQLSSSRMSALGSKGIRWRSDYWQTGSALGNASFELSRNDMESLFMFNLSLRIGTGNQFHSLMPQLYRDSTGTDMRGIVESAWQRNDGNQTMFSVRAAHQGRDSLEARMSQQGRMLGSDVTARYDASTSDTSIFGRLESSVAIGQGNIVATGRQPAESAFSVTVDGATPDAAFDVVVNGSVLEVVYAGKQVLVPVAPYRTYQVELQPRGNRLINLDKGAQTRVVYPGNVVGLHWTASSILIIYGRIVDEAGAAIGDALVGNASGLAITEDDGRFQAEVDSNLRELRLRSKGRECIVRLPRLDASNVMTDLGTLVCRLVPVPGEDARPELVQWES